LRKVKLLLSLLIFGSFCYCQENSIEPPKILNDTVKLDSIMHNDFFDFVNKEVLKNALKDSEKLPDNYTDFKRKFLALKLDNEPIDIGLPKVKHGIPPLLDKNYLSSPWFALASPISFLYYNFSKAERSKRKAYELRHEKDQYAVIDNKINRHKIQYWTGLKENDLDKFILFCDFSFDYLLSANEYELIQKVKQKLQDFKDTNKFMQKKDTI
jgi:hypothetical protein